jgi:MOSC domain-containing protein YiiM
MIAIAGRTTLERDAEVAGLLSVDLRHLYTSSGHSFVGHHGRPPGNFVIEDREFIRCVAGRGIEGDRYFDHAENFKGQITFFSWDVFVELCIEMNAAGVEPSALRRNVIVQGVDLNALIGREFEIGGVRFFGTEECRPCYWMDHAVGPGTEKFLKGRGGLRARILTNGVLWRGASDMTLDLECSTGLLPVNPGANYTGGTPVSHSP